MKIRIYLQHPNDLQRHYFTKEQVDEFLTNFKLQEWRFLRPFRQIEFTINDFQELPGFGILEDRSRITLLFERN